MGDSMFVFSFRSVKAKLIVVLVLLVMLGVGIAILAKEDTKSVEKSNGVVLKANNSKERIAFLSQFGWEVVEDPIEVCEVIIPAEFDETYKKYNEIQKAQNLDLEKYKGVRAKRWTYEIKNYPGYAASQSPIRANLLVYEGNVIGGDICSVELDGFMQGFEMPEEKVVETSGSKNATG